MSVGTITLLLASVFLLILSIFLYFYYGIDNANLGILITVLFGLGIAFGLMACIIYIYLRTPVKPVSTINY